MDESTRVGDDSKTVVYRTTFDPDSDPATDAVTSSLAEVTGVPPDEMEPVAAVVDPAAFDSLVRNRRRVFRMSFTYNEHEVEVASHGEVTVCRTSVGDPIREVSIDADEAPSNAVVRALAAVKDVDETDIEPLFPVVDPDAIDALYDQGRSSLDAALRLSFRFDDLFVEMTPDRSVSVRSAPE